MDLSFLSQNVVSLREPRRKRNWLYAEQKGEAGRSCPKRRMREQSKRTSRASKVEV